MLWSWPQKSSMSQHMIWHSNAYAYPARLISCTCNCTQASFVNRRLVHTLSCSLGSFVYAATVNFQLNFVMSQLHIGVCKRVSVGRRSCPGPGSMQLQMYLGDLMLSVGLGMRPVCDRSIDWSRSFSCLGTSAIASHITHGALSHSSAESPLGGDENDLEWRYRCAYTIISGKWLRQFSNLLSSSWGCQGSGMSALAFCTVLPGSLHTLECERPPLQA